MRERLLNQVILTRKLRVLLLFVAVLLPLGSWADNYPFKIGGVQITSENIGSYSGVSYDASNCTITLNGAKLTSGICWESEDGLVIALKGANTITVSSGSCIYSELAVINPNAVRQKARQKAPANYEISFVKDGSSSDPCSLTLSWPEGGTIGALDGFSNKDNPDLPGLTWIILDQNKAVVAEPYDMTIGDIIVSSANYSPIIGLDGNSINASYDISTHTLTLDGATLTERIFWDADADFTIELKGSNSITTDGTSCIASGFDKNISFTRGDASNPCSLELSTGTSTENVISEFANSGAPTMGSGLFWFPTKDNNNKITSAIVTTVLGGGEGTQESPFIINTYDHLKQYADYVNSGMLTTQYVRLGDDDIDCSGKTDFKVIGLTTPFKGHFDGNGKVIKNLNIEVSTGDAHVGLFSQISGGTVENLTLSSCSFSGGEYTGGVAGNLSSGTIKNCNVNACSIETSGDYAGAIVGNKANDITLSNNLYDVDVTVKTNNTGSDPTTKSGQTPRGIGNSDDEIDKVMLAGIKKVTVNYPKSYGGLEPIENTYYLFDDDIIYVLPGYDVGIKANSVAGRKPTLTLSDQSIDVTSEEKMVDGSYDHTEFSFTMPSADVTATLSFIKDLSSNIYTATIANSAYTGAAQTSQEVSLSYNGDDITPFTLDTHYTIDGYKDADKHALESAPKNVGTYYATIKGVEANGFTGTRDVQFEITKANLSIVTIEAIKDQIYTGSEIKPEIKVTLNDVTLTPDDYGYSVGYSNNTNVPASGATSGPTVTLTALATSKYFTEGTTKTAAFNIVPKSIEGATVTLSGDGFDTEKKCFVYNGQNQAPTVTVKDGDKLLILDTDYTLSNNGGVGVADDYSVTVTGKGNYDENTSVDVTYSIAPRSIAETNVNLDATVTYVYTGGEHNPEPVVKYGDTELVKGTDYTLSYSNNINAAASGAENAPTVTITGMGNFDENTTTTVKFTIGQADLADAAISKISFGGTDYTVGDAAIEIPYTGEAIHPTVKEVKFNDGTVTLDASQYTVSWGDHNTELSSESENAQVIITSTGKNFTAGTSTSLNFKIVAANVTISAPDQTVTYNGSAQAYTSATVDNTNATLAVAYYTKEDDRTNGSNALAGAPTDAGTYYVRVTQTNSNFTADAKNATFTITAATMTVTATGYDAAYDGQAHGISVTAPEGATVKYGESATSCTLEASPTYTNAGTYTVYYEVTKANYGTVTGSATVTISKAAGSISYATASMSKTFGDAAFTNALTKTGDGSVTYSSSNTAVATVDSSTGEVTIKGEGTAKITATVADGTNYSYATKTASYTLSVGVASMEVSATGYDAVYDGQPHGIGVTAPEDATVKYGETEGSYTLDASPTYTNAGFYTVYYEVTKANYTTVTGSAAVKISKVPVTLFMDVSDKTIKKDEKIRIEYSTSPVGLPIVFSSSDDAVAMISTIKVDSRFAELIVKALYPGEATITATYDGGTNYESISASFTVTVEVEAIQAITENQEYSFGNANDYLKPDGSENPLNGVVINNIFHNLRIDDATGYDSEEGCIAIGTPTSPENIRGAVEGFGNFIADGMAPYDPNNPLYWEYQAWLEASWSGMECLVEVPKEGQIGVFTVESKEEGACQIAVQPGVGETQTFQHVERSEDGVIITPEDGRMWQDRLDAMGCGDVWRHLYGGKPSTGTENLVMLFGIFNRFIGGDARSKAIHKGKKSGINVKVYSVTYKVKSTSGIESIGRETKILSADGWYDLYGQRISQPQQKGIYINNGRKIVIK